MTAVSFRDVRPYLSSREETEYRRLLREGDPVPLVHFRTEITTIYEDEVLAERAFAQEVAA